MIIYLIPEESIKSMSFIFYYDGISFIILKFCFPISFLFFLTLWTSSCLLESSFSLALLIFSPAFSFYYFISLATTFLRLDMLYLLSTELLKLSFMESFIFDTKIVFVILLIIPVFVTSCDFYASNSIFYSISA